MDDRSFSPFVLISTAIFSTFSEVTSLQKSEEDHEKNQTFSSQSNPEHKVVVTTI